MGKLLTSLTLEHVSATVSTARSKLAPLIGSSSEQPGPPMQGIAERLARVSVFQKAALGLSSFIGVLVGIAFLQDDPRPAWTCLFGGFLTVMLIMGITGLGRCVQQRIRRGEWRRCLILGSTATFPATTCYILAVWLVSLGTRHEPMMLDGFPLSHPSLLAVAPGVYLVTLVLALLVGPGYMLTSPFKASDTQHLPEAAQR
jgi:hypothetical protein